MTFLEFTERMLGSLEDLLYSKLTECTMRQVASRMCQYIHECIADGSMHPDNTPKYMLSIDYVDCTRVELVPFDEKTCYMTLHADTYDMSSHLSQYYDPNDYVTRVGIDAKMEWCERMISLSKINVEVR